MSLIWSDTLLPGLLELVVFCVCITALLLLLIILKIFNSKASKADFTVHCSDNDKLSRRLGMLEQVLLEREKINGWGTVTSVLLLDSAHELNQDHLRKALGLLTKRYPLLRMRIKDIDSGHGACFEEMENPETVDFELLDKITSDDWIEGFEDELNSYLFDIGKGPLWRVRLLKETFSEGKFRNALVFTFQHVICDALSIFELQKFLLKLLTALHGGEEFKVESLPFRPPLESLMPELVQPNILERLLFSSFFMLQSAKNIFFKPKNSFLSVYPPVANAEPSVMKKTCLLARSLSEEETKLLITSCKANKCTVHGAITASTHLAIARIMQKEKQDLKTPVSVESSYSISVRKECEPKVNSDDFGAYVSASALSIPIPLISSTDKQGFWELARACTREVHTQVNSGKHRKLLKFYHCIDIPSYCKMSKFEHNQGRRNHICNINNYGSQQTNLADNSPYKFAGTYFGIQAAKTGHVFGNNLMTVDGRLYWAVEYFPHVTTKTQAEELFELSLEILKHSCMQ